MEACTNGKIAEISRFLLKKRELRFGHIVICSKVYKIPADSDKTVITKADKKVKINLKLLYPLVI